MVGAAETPRWFYTDPLAAAWMAKYFGMTFGLYFHGQMIWEPVHFSHKDGSEPFASADDILETDIPLYVHPASLHLLEPRPGDAVTDGETVGRVHQHWAGERHVVFWAGNEQETALDDTERVIQRDGKPFLMPERA